MKLFAMLFSMAFFFSLFLFKEKDSKHASRDIATKQKSLANVDGKYNRSYINLAPDFPYTGLIHKPGYDGEYMQRVFGKLIQSAHKYSHEDWLDPTKGMYLTYNNYLLLALQVPVHESRLMHFTYRDPKHYCVFANNALDPVANKDHVLKFETAMANEKAQEIYDLIPSLKEKYTTPKTLRAKFCNQIIQKQKYSTNKDPEYYPCSRLKTALIRISNWNLLNENFPRFYKLMQDDFDVKNCSKLAKFENVKQMQFANDYADVGIFMFNSSSHPNMFLTNSIFDFDMVIDYGIEFLYKGYKVVANHNLKKHPKDYAFKEYLSCLDGLDARTFEGRVYLMRSAWAGNYNSGRVEKSCRIEQTHKAFINARKDIKEGYVINDREYFVSMAKFFIDFEDTEAFRTTFDGVELPAKKSWRKSLFHRYLPVDSIERKAFEEIVFNVFYGKNKNTFIKQVLKKDYNSESEIILTQEDLKNEKHQTEILALNEPAIIEKLDETKIEDVEQVSEAIIINETQERIDEALNSTELEVIEEDIQVDSVNIPFIDERLFTYIISGKDSNIRKQADFAESSVCGNSYYAEVKPVKLIKTSEEGEFFKVILEKEDMIRKEKCRGLEHFYVHHSQVEKVKDYDLQMIVKLVAPVALRIKPGKNEKYLNYILPSNNTLVIINENLKQDKYVWYEAILESGERGWFYAGTIGGKQKIEVLSE